jgi:hypothetical protein
MRVMNENRARSQHLFVVRMWSETYGDNPTQWRGSVQHISSGQRYYFISMHDLNDFISLNLTAPIEHHSIPNGKEI